MTQAATLPVETITKDGKAVSILNRKSPVPLYHQLSERLEQEIDSGVYENIQFPTGKKLAQKYNVSEIVIRQALSNLTNRGLLIRERGRGTFVRPNAAGTTSAGEKLRTGRLGLVMFWGPDTLFSPLVPAIERIASDAGYHLILVNNQGNPKTERSRIRELMEHGVDGVFWLPSDKGPTHSFAKTVFDAMPALVAIDREINVKGARINLVEADNFGGMFRIVKYLVSKGHKRIAYARKPFSATSIEERYQGYCQALRESGIVPSNEWAFTSKNSSYECGHKCAEAILESNHLFDAVCCDTDTIAIGVMDIFHQKGVKIPDDIAVTGFNDNREASLVSPKLTTVRIDVEKIGTEAVQLMLRQLEQSGKNEPVEPFHITVPVELVIRESA